MLFNLFELLLLLLLVFITRHLPSCSATLKINLKRVAHTTVVWCVCLTVVPSFSDITPRFDYQPQFQDQQKPHPLISRRVVQRRYYRLRIKSQKTVQSVQHNTRSFYFRFHFTSLSQLPPADYYLVAGNWTVLQSLKI